MTSFFPAPDKPYEPEDCSVVQVLGATVFRIMTAPEGIAVSALLSHGGEDKMFRFTLPRHARVVREIFKRGGYKEIPRDHQQLNITGMVAVEFQGTLVGEDSIPESDKAMPEVLYVMDGVKARIYGGCARCP